MRNRGETVGDILVGVVGITVLIVLWLYHDPSVLKGALHNNPFAPQVAPVPDDWKRFASDTLGISLRYPASYSVDASYTPHPGGRRGIVGVKVIIPDEMTEGTNLSSTDSGVSVEILPDGSTCAGSDFVYQGLALEAVSEGSVHYSVIKTAESAAGNLYEETVYVISDSKPCTAVRYLIHSTNLANYPGTAIQAFDKKLLIKEFDVIRRSVVLPR